MMLDPRVSTRRASRASATSEYALTSRAIRNPSRDVSMKAPSRSSFAPKEDLDGAFIETSREGFRIALDVSAYSLVALAREARGVLGRGSSVMTLTYYGAEKVVSNYRVMGIAKAALEACVKYLAAELGPQGIRVNAISPGPVRTLAAHGVAGFKSMYKTFPEIAPLRSTITIEDVGRSALYLASELSSAVTGEVIYADGGFNILGIATGDA